ncbi:hypothetical protein H6F67_17140 [Microcoleus sp. FACHB-1515]|uniref:hypothetical protein n=1 Tax=Cyanophyceae TaxID=3028117 RepID=UPI001682CE09|nr:hypothetical protein [Microcoleus sp. FACHB-1515]MBD2091571.1 hypothetical protein [Microcoleus sp. FACHB-1515]
MGNQPDLILLSSGFMAGQAFAPIQQAGADNLYAYQSIDKHCVDVINRDVRIGFDTAFRVRELGLFRSSNDVIAITGDRSYCQMNAKTIQTPNGIYWGTPYLFPIAGENQVLVVYIDRALQFLGTETWGIDPEVWESDRQSWLNSQTRQWFDSRAAAPREFIDPSLQFNQLPQQQEVCQ